jgi:acylphosphatase
VTDTPHERLHAIIDGLVQGVGFRHAAYRHASNLGLTGWVRNREDGRVEAVFEGERAVLEQMLAWCHKGPVLSRVKSVERQWDAATGEFTDFGITF